MKFGEEMGRRGVLKGGERLRPTTDATTVRVRDGEVLTSDGPFAETKEQIGGFYLVDCKDLDEAIEVASKIPGARTARSRCGRSGRCERRRRGRGRDGVPDEWGRIVATLIRGTGDWDLAEECAQDAFALALETWGRDGVPRNPGAWLTTTARNRARRPAAPRRDRAAKLQEVAVLVASRRPRRARRQRRRRRPAAAHLHVLPPGAVGRRAGRAHAAHARRPHHRRDRARVPRARADDGAAARAARSARSATPASPTACRPRTCCPERTRAVLARALPAVQRGYAPTAGADSCAAACATKRSGSRARWSHLMPDEPEALGLLALHAAARLAARRARRRRRRPRAARRAGPHALGSRRDRRRARRSSTRALRRERARARTRCRPRSRRATRPPRDARRRPTGVEIAALYGELARMVPSPVVELNRAVAVAMADGPEAGLALVDALDASGRAAPATTCCPRPAPTSCAASIGAPRPPPPTGPRSRCRQPTPSAATCGVVWRKR